jgi:FTR1 family protein
MLSSLIITLREGIEGALAVAIVLLYLRKTGRDSLVPAVWWGLIVAIVASIIGAFILEKITINNEAFEGILMLAAAFFVGTMVVWMWRSAKGLKKEIENKIETIATKESAGAGAWFAIFFFTFLMIFREGIETVIFLSAVSLTTDSLMSFMGGLLGLILAILFGVFFVRGSLQIDLGRFFKITGIVLLLFVIQLIIGGFHELSEAGYFPANPTTMAIIGPIVNHNALFLIGVLLIPFLMLVIPSSRKPLPESSGSRADQRLHLSEARRQKLWRTAASVLSVCLALFIGFDYVYGEKKTLSTPVPVTASDGMIRIPLSNVNDGNLHRYILDGTSVRFILMKLDDGSIATAFDACKICGSQGYTQEGGAVICLNCSADINSATIGRSGGCNPIPLHSRVEGDFVEISASELQSEVKTFGN